MIVATPHAPWTKAMLDALADGRWYTRDRLIAIGVKAVPPGRAFRTGERLRGYGRAVPGPRLRGDDTTSVATGARDTARQAIHGLLLTGHIEQRTVDGTILLRRAR